MTTLRDAQLADRETAEGRRLRREYRAACIAVRARENNRCQACGAPAHYTHHIHSVGETSMHSIMFADPANLMLLCDDCHALMHPLLRGGPRWRIARALRGIGLRRA